MTDRDDFICAGCGYEFDSVEEAEACLDGHQMADEEMAYFDSEDRR